MEPNAQDRYLNEKKKSQKNQISYTNFCKPTEILYNMQCGRPGFDPWVGKIPWRRAWQPTSVFLPGESPWTEEPGGLHSPQGHRVRHK